MSKKNGDAGVGKTMKIEKIKQRQKKKADNTV